MIILLSNKEGKGRFMASDFKKTNKHFSAWEIVIFILALLVAIIFIVSMIINLSGKSSEVIEPPISDGETHYFTYNGNQLIAKNNVCVNLKDKEAFSFDDGILTYSGEEKTYFGIDVSYAQGDIDWQRVKDAGVDFVMIRVARRGATQGGLYEDENYKKNIEGASAVGLDVGAYFYSQAITAEEAKEEADMLIDLLKPYKKKITYPVVFDWEHYYECEEPYRTKGTPTDVLTNACKTFCETVKSAGYTPMVYFNLELAYMEYDIGQLADYDFWIAEFDAIPSFYYDYAMAQYTARGRIDGIENSVDLNLCFKDFSAE